MIFPLSEIYSFNFDLTIQLPFSKLFSWVLFFNSCKFYLISSFLWLKINLYYWWFFTQYMYLNRAYSINDSGGQLNANEGFLLNVIGWSASYKLVHDIGKFNIVVVVSPIASYYWKYAKQSTPNPS